jgi:hypothetical protein
MLNRIVIPALAVVSAVYAVLATDLMRPVHQPQPPLYPPPRPAFPAAVAAVVLIEPPRVMFQMCCLLIHNTMPNS